MDDNAGKFYIEDGEIKESQGLKDTIANGGVMIYDVIRIIDGIPLFFGDHYNRTIKSFEAIGSSCSIDSDEMMRQIQTIIDMNGSKNCNIKFIMFTSDGRPKTIGYICRSHYPTAEEIKKGVSVGLYSLERENPNIKMVDNDYKRKINQIKNENGFYEVFLIDRDGNVNEGGTSNIFFVKNDEIFTAPDEKVLKGITRMRVIESCKEAGRNVIETPVHVDRVFEADGVFISGTSPKVMPVTFIEDKRFDSANHPIINEIRLAFDYKIEKYILDKLSKASKEDKV